MHLKKKDKQRGTKCPAQAHLWLFQHLVPVGPLREQLARAIAGRPPVLGRGREGLLGVCVRHVQVALSIPPQHPAVPTFSLYLLLSRPTGANSGPAPGPAPPPKAVPSPCLRS